MKSLLIAVSALLVSVNVSAYTPSASDSWDTIRSNFFIHIDEPSVKLDVGAFTTTAFFVCKEGNQLRTLKPFTRCLEWSTEDEDAGSSRYCLDEQKYYGTATIEGTRERCTSWTEVDSGDSVESICTNYETYTYTQPLSFNISVYKEAEENEDRGRKLFTKAYTIPNCK